MEFTLYLHIKPPAGRLKTVAVKKKEIVIGRDKTCDVKILDPEISRRHACLRVLSSDRITISDLGSSNGTYIKNSPITRDTKVNSGTVIRMGNSVITIETRDVFKREFFDLEIPRESFLSPSALFDKQMPVTFSDSTLFFECVSELLPDTTERFNVESVLNGIADVMQAENGVFIVDSGVSGIETVVRVRRGKSISIPQNCLDTVFQNGSCFLFPLKTRSDTYSMLKKHGIGSALCSSGSGSEKVLAAIYLDRGTEKPEFTSDDLAVLCHLTHLCALSLLNDQRHQEVKNTLDSLKMERQKLFDVQTNWSDSQLPGTNKKIQQLMFTAMRVGQSDRHVFICGNHGSGRSFLAQRIHFSSSRKNEPFVSLNCLSLSRETLSETVFGIQDRPDFRGLLELCGSGTLYLKEISALPVSAQNRLFQILDSVFLTFDNGSRKIPVSGRVIVSSNIHPEKPVFEHAFDQEFIKLMSPVVLCVPRLSERMEDILPLANFFLRQYLPKNRMLPEFHPQAADVLMRYSWPGNIAELRDAMCYTAAACRDGDIQIGDLPPGILELSSSSSPKNLNLRQQLDMLETSMIRTALEKNRNIITKAAYVLGLSESTLRYRMQRLNISV